MHKMFSVLAITALAISGAASAKPTAPYQVFMFHTDGSQMTAAELNIASQIQASCDEQMKVPLGGSTSNGYSVSRNLCLQTMLYKARAEKLLPSTFTVVWGVQASSN